MEQINKMEFGKVMLGLAVNFNTTVSKEQMDFFYQMFLDDGICITQIKQAAKNIIRTKKDGYGRMPTYAEFIEFIQGNREQIAEIEAQKIINLVRSEGAYSNPVSNPTIKHIIDSRFGGWKALCGTLEESKLQWFIRDFKEAYLSTRVDELMIDDKFQSALEYLH